MSAEIPLTQGCVALVDDADYEWLSQWPWHLHKNSGGRLYARRARRRAEPGDSHWIRMHRLILPPPPGLHVDHINRDGLDNRRLNLRHCTPSQNQANRVAVRSGYRGVRRSGRGWAACFRTKYLGTFATATAAASAFDAAAFAYFGPFARLNRDNFPEIAALLQRSA